MFQEIIDETFNFGFIAKGCLISAIFYLEMWVKAKSEHFKLDMLHKQFWHFNDVVTFVKNFSSHSFFRRFLFFAFIGLYLGKKDYDKKTTKSLTVKVKRGALKLCSQKEIKNLQNAFCWSRL